MKKRMEKDFYVSLPSNGDMINNPSNTQSYFKTNIIPTIFLNGEWKVGLTEISFSNNYLHKIGRGQITINKHFKEVKIKTRKTSKQQTNTTETTPTISTDTSSSSTITNTTETTPTISTNDGLSSSITNTTETSQTASRIDDVTSMNIDETTDENYREFILLNDSHLPYKYSFDFYASPKSNLRDEFKKSFHTFYMLLFNIFIQIQAQYNKIDLYNLAATNLLFNTNNDILDEDKDNKKIKEYFDDDLKSEFFKSFFEYIFVENKLNLKFDEKGSSLKNEIKIELFGPMVNLLTDDKEYMCITNILKEYNSDELKKELKLSDILYSEIINIYSDIVDEQYFGNNKFNIIRSVIPTSDSPIYHEIFTNVDYVNCKNINYINNISIRITSLNGENLKFNDLYSKSFIKLHFIKNNGN